MVNKQAPKAGGCASDQMLYKLKIYWLSTDFYWLSTESLLTSTDSLLTSTDPLLTSTDSLLISTDSLLTSADSLLTSTDSLLASTDSLLISTDSLLASTSSLLTSILLMTFAEWTYLERGSYCPEFETITHPPTDRPTWVGSRDASASKNCIGKCI